MTDIEVNRGGTLKQAPIKKAKMKPRTKQPKKVKFITTEIRCQEKSKGGLCYEVILAEPSVLATPPKAIGGEGGALKGGDSKTQAGGEALAGSPPKLSVEEIQDKLRKAEERRLSLEANKMAAWTAKMARIEEASRKKDEQTGAFVQATKEALEAKMETHTGKREALLGDLRRKMKEHLEGVERNRLSLEQQTEEVRSAMQEKVELATAHRDENIKKMLDRLKEHEEQVQRVRCANAEKFQQLEAAIGSKLQLAEQRRLQLEREQREKLRNHNTVKIAEIRSSIETQDELLKSEKSKIIENKLSTAEQKRAQEIQKKLDQIKEHDRRAELVRQNKAALGQNEDSCLTTVTASSG